MVFVPVPRESQKVARELSAGLRGVIRGPGMRYVIWAAAILTAAQAVPHVGLVVTGVAMTMGAAAYGAILRAAGGDKADPARGWRQVAIPSSPTRAVLCALMAAGTVIPLWVLGAGPGLHPPRSPHWTPTGIGIAAATWTILPIALLMAYGSDGRGHSPMGFRKGLGLIGRHPFATVLALATVPAGLALIDVVLGSLFYIMGHLSFFALEFMPMPGTPSMNEGVPLYHMIDYRLFPPAKFLAGYFDAIHHGYTFVAAVPASLSLSTRAGMNPMIISADPWMYTIIRVFLVFVIDICLLATVAIQARWLGAIPAFESRRPA